MSTASRLFRFLEQNPGKKLVRKELGKRFSTLPSRRISGKLSHFNRFRGMKYSPDHTDVEVLLAELKLLNMVEYDGSKVIPRDPFLAVARASVSPSGAVFASVRGADPAARDLFIAAARSMNALTGDEILVRLTDKSRDRFEGTVVEIRNKARELFRLRLLSDPVHRVAPGILLDASTRISAGMTVSRMSADLTKRMKQDVVVIVKLTGRNIMHMGLPLLEADFVRFEKDSDMDADYARILMKYNFNPIYPQIDGVPEYESERTEVQPESVVDWKGRRDLRNIETVTIDGPDSKDFDDAISLVRVSNKAWKLYVHIADVSHYVLPGTELDNEAQRRATSVYLANRVVPMLPPVLSENLCSLVADRNRLAFTAEMDIKPETGEIVRYEIYKSIIRVNRRLTYENAEGELDKKDSDLSHIWRIAQLQKEARLKSGRIDLDLREPKIKYNDKGEVVEVTYRQRLKSSMLIEECMLSANICTAEFQRKKGAATLYRVHESMEERKLESLNHFLKIGGIDFKLNDTEPRSINKTLLKVKDFAEKGKGTQKGSRGKLEGVSPERIFQMLLLRSFMQAKYAGEPLGHYGLGFEDYCHFTSPIRRYPDLVVHRALESILRKKKPVYSKEDIDELGLHTSEMERKAMDAERDIWKLKMLRSIEKSGQKKFRAFITGFKTDRVFLEMLDFNVECIVTANHLTNDFELVLPDPFSVFIKKLSRPAFLGEVWNVDLERLDTEEMKLFVKPIW
ncbi:MAG: VacB/RNase II family 3'-5' exoribonuclease [Leptospirales bacterium]|nr:VacB/RNase II family 3'-5' exoribonuclease [Leptospirales bacterium]